MEIIKTEIEGLLIVKPKVFKDKRGFFLEPYSRRAFSENGIANQFVQDNHSLSVEKGVLRGLHFQKPPYAQAKLLRVFHGSIYDVAVDLRKESPTYGKWRGFILTNENFKLLYIPIGFAHGFCTLEENTEVFYKCDNFYMPEYEGSIRWNDPLINIDWPVNEPIISERDSNASFFKDFTSPF